MKLFYFTDVRKLEVKNTSDEKTEIDCGSLTVMERLFFSVYASSKLYHPNKTFAEIIFDYKDGEIYTAANFKDYDGMVTQCIKHYPLLAAYIDDNIGKKDENGDFVLNGRDIDNSNVFTSKNGNKGGNGKTSPLNSIAVKTFILAALKRKKKQEDKLSTLNIFNWSNASLCYENIKENSETAAYLKANSSHKENIKTSIKKWAAKNNIVIEINGNELFVKGKKKVEDCAELSIEPYEKSKFEETKKRVEEAPKGSKMFDVFKEPETHAEASKSIEQTFDDFTPEDWEKYYQDLREHNKNLPIIIRYCNNEFGDINEMKNAIGKECGVKADVFEKFLTTGFVNAKDKNTAVNLKNALRVKINALKDKILSARIDSSWQGENYPELGNIFVAYAYASFPFMSKEY